MGTPRITKARAKCASRHLGLWVVEPLWFAQAFAAVKVDAYPIAEDSPDDEPVYKVGPDGVAVIDIVDHITKGDSKFGGTSSVRTRRAIQEANADEQVRGILLYVDSPGGTAAGVSELATAVRDSGKPVHAFIDDLGASAAYWVASQAARISTNAAGEIGSIGTYAVAYDESGAYDEAGIKVHLISTGPFKGAFADGVPVTDEHLAYLRERVAAVNTLFQAAVKTGRNFDAAGLKTVSDGRVFGAKEAKRLGLVDGIETQEQARTRLAKLVQPKGTPRRDRATRALRIAELTK